MNADERAEAIWSAYEVIAEASRDMDGIIRRARDARDRLDTLRRDMEWMYEADVPPSVREDARQAVYALWDDMRELGRLRDLMMVDRLVPMTETVRTVLDDVEAER